MALAQKTVPDAFYTCGKCEKKAPKGLEYCPFCGHHYLIDRIYRDWPDDCSRTVFSLYLGKPLLTEKGEIVDQKKVLEKSKFEFEYQGKVEKMGPPNFESVMILPKQSKCEMKVRTYIQGKLVDERILVLDIPKEADNLAVDLLPVSFSYKSSLFSRGTGISFKIGRTKGSVETFKFRAGLRF